MIHYKDDWHCGRIHWLISCFLITLCGAPLVITFYSCMVICQSSCSFKDLSVLCVFFCVCQEKDECNSKTCTGLCLEEICHRCTIKKKKNDFAISKYNVILFNFFFFLKHLNIFNFKINWFHNIFEMYCLITKKNNLLIYLQ